MPATLWKQSQMDIHINRFSTYRNIHRQPVTVSTQTCTQHTQIKPVSKHAYSHRSSLAAWRHEHSSIFLIGNTIISEWRWYTGYILFIYIVKQSEFASHQEHIWVLLSTCPNPQAQSHIAITCHSPQNMLFTGLVLQYTHNPAPEFNTWPTMPDWFYTCVCSWQKSVCPSKQSCCCPRPSTSTRENKAFFQFYIKRHIHGVWIGLSHLSYQSLNATQNNTGLIKM